MVLSLHFVTMHVLIIKMVGGCPSQEKSCRHAFELGGDASIRWELGLLLPEALAVSRLPSCPAPDEVTEFVLRDCDLLDRQLHFVQISGQH